MRVPVSQHQCYTPAYYLSAGLTVGAAAHSKTLGTYCHPGGNLQVRRHHAGESQPYEVQADVVHGACNVSAAITGVE